MKVLVAVDGSDESMVAVDAVGALPMPVGSAVTVVAVIPDNDSVFGDPLPAIRLVEPPDARARLLRELRERLEGIADGLRTPALSVNITIAEGRPASQIVLEAGRAKADLIVMGARGLSAVQRLLVGSVSSEVVDHAPCPVLVARRRSVARVMLASDGGPAAAAAAEFIAGCGLFVGAQIHVLSVTEPARPWWTGFAPADAAASTGSSANVVELADKRAHEATEDAVQRLRDLDVVDMSVRGDADVVAAILAEADTWHPDIIVVGARNFGAAHRWLVGSVSRSILHLAEMSVLVVRPRVA